MATEISALGKQALLSELFSGSGYANVPGVRIWSGNKGASVIVHKVFSERVDFDLVYNPLRHLGRKLAVNVIGELYAQSCIPSGADISLALSNRFSVEDVKEFWEGVLSVAKDYSLSQLSLDLVPSAAGMIVSIAGWGSREHKVDEERKAPKSTDLLVLSGDLGAAYMGLHVLEREKTAFEGVPSGTSPKQPDLQKYKYIVGEYLSPYLRPGIPQRFSEAGIIPCSGYFVTKGLGAAVKQAAAETGLGVKVYVGKIPISSKTFEMADELAIDPLTAAINGGDDYRLLYIVPIEFHETLRKDFQDWDVIGHLARPEVGTALVTPEGAEIAIRVQSYDE